MEPRRRVDLGLLGRYWIPETTLWTGIGLSGFVVGSVIGGIGTFALMHYRMNSLRSIAKQFKAARDEALTEVVKINSRSIKDVAEAKQFGCTKLLKSILPVSDDLDRALNHNGTMDMKGLQNGVSMTRDILQKVFKENGLTKISAVVGSPFIPDLHESMIHESKSEIKANCISRVFVDGYYLEGRVLRPSQVAVAKNEANLAASPNIILTGEEMAFKSKN